MKKDELALNHFQAGFNCAQSVLLSFAADFGLEEKFASSISQAFGGGLARLGEICGAVSGGLMVLGLKYGKVRPDDDAARDITYQLAREFIASFRKKNGSVMCRELLGLDLSQEGAYELAHQQDLFRQICHKLICSAVEIVGRLLEEPIAQAK